MNKSLNYDVSEDKGVWRLEKNRKLHSLDRNKKEVKDEKNPINKRFIVTLCPYGWHSVGSGDFTSRVALPPANCHSPGN